MVRPGISLQRARQLRNATHFTIGYDFDLSVEEWPRELEAADVVAEEQPLTEEEEIENGLRQD